MLVAVTCVPRMYHHNGANLCTNQDNGVIIHNKCKLQNLVVRQHEVEVQLGVLQDDGSVVPREPFTVESVLFSVGRTPNTERLNLMVRVRVLIRQWL